MKFLFFLLCLFLLSFNADAATTYWASPTGNNSLCAVGTSDPGSGYSTIAKAITCVVAGDTIMLKDGTYQGANNMISTNGLNGTPSNPITIRAQNDGGALIDGEYITGRRPVLIFNSSYLNLEGFNAKRGGNPSSTDGNATVVSISGASHHITFRRVIAWDALDDPNFSQAPGPINGNDPTVWAVTGGSSDCLFEDVGGFGTGRYVFYSIGITNQNNTVRRGWFRYNEAKELYSVPRATMLPDYRGSETTLVENTILEWRASSASTYGNNPYIMLEGAGFNGYEFTGQVRLYGSLLFIGPGSQNYQGQAGSTSAIGLWDVSKHTKIRDFTCVIHPNNFAFGNCITTYSAPASGYDGELTNILTVGSNSNSINSGWNPTNVSHYSSLTGPPNSYVYFTDKYVDGVKVPGQTFWPWPMRQRIIDATTGSGWPVADVHADVAAVLNGPPPSGGPIVVITGPSSNPTHSVSTATTTLSGTSTQSGGTVAYSNDRGGSGSTGTVANWSFSPVALLAGINTITVTGTDSSSIGVDSIALTYVPTFPGNSLVGAWAFEEGAGTSATDSSGNSNTGTLINTPTRVAGRYGQAIQLNGTNQYIRVSNSNSIDLTHSFTISAWVQPSAVHTDWRAVMSKNADPLSSPYQLYANIQGRCGSGGIAGYTDVNGIAGPIYEVCDATPLPIGTWSHLAITYDGANLRLYKNGVLLTTTAASGYMEPSGQELIIGGSEIGENFHGLIDEVRLYNWGIPITAASNTVAGAACTIQNQTDSRNSPSIVGDMNCPIPALALTQFKLGAGSQLKFGSSATSKIGANP